MVSLQYYMSLSFKSIYTDISELLLILNNYLISFNVHANKNDSTYYFFSRHIIVTFRPIDPVCLACLDQNLKC